MINGDDSMIFETLSVHRNGPLPNSRPRIHLYGDWLPEMGFVHGALVQAVPETDGFVFNLRNKNINYGDLFDETKEKSGTLVSVFISHNSFCPGPSLVTTGWHIGKGGLKIGDTLIAKCEYGQIRARKISENMRLVSVASVKARGKTIPRLWLRSGLMNGINFTPDTLVTAASEPGCITFTAHDKGIVYSDIVRFARQNKMKLIQVTVHGGEPLLNITGSCIDRAGFVIGDMLAACFEQGCIRLQKFDPKRFGF